MFDRLPLAAVIDRDIFCIHGGIPRPLPGSQPGDSRLEMICRIPAVSGINPPYDHEEEHLRQLASECIWSDPAGEDQEEGQELGEDGFGESPRGGGTICFGNKALDDFLEEHQLSYIMRVGHCLLLFSLCYAELGLVLSVSQPALDPFLSDVWVRVPPRLAIGTRGACLRSVAVEARAVLHGVLNEQGPQPRQPGNLRLCSCRL